MRLSEAIRLGSMLGPQAHGMFTRSYRRFLGLGPRVTEYCALGAAYEAATGGKYREVKVTNATGSFRGKATIGAVTHEMETPPEWPLWLDRTCPECSLAGPIYRLIPHLNDVHRWTREAIADWVEQIEQREAKSEPVELFTPDEEYVTHG